MSKIPHVLNKFNVYDDGDELVGVVSVELPTLGFMTETISGGGIAGELEVPILGLLKSMEMTFKERTITDRSFKFMKPGANIITMRKSIQQQDPKTGLVSSYPMKVVATYLAKELNLGSAEEGKAMDGENKVEITRLAITVDGKAEVLIDKLNYICMIGGIDYLEQSRKHLGI